MAATVSRAGSRGDEVSEFGFLGADIPGKPHVGLYYPRRRRGLPARCEAVAEAGYEVFALG